MDFTLYNSRKTKLQHTITSTLSLLQSLKLTTTHKRLTEDAARLADERFNLVIIGEFSRGKSTFVNALLGKNILPASKEATTNIISKIVYGEQPKYVLFYKDGKKQEISKEEFDLIKAQTEDKPDKFSLLKGFVGRLKHEESHVDFGNIDHAEISYPLSFCENQVDVVDTPGTNDLNVGRIEITYRYLRQAEAAILVLSATQPLTRTEKEFLVEQVVGNNIKDIFIVINYKDQVIGEEERVIQHVLDNLQDVQDFSQRIFIVSSKQALLYRRKQAGEVLKSKALLNCPATLADTGIEELETALARFLLGEIKRGKSTFINALIGNDLLPTDVLPETATINALIYNEKPELKIIMQDGSVEQGQVERSFLERFSAKNQTEECSKIKYLKIGYPFKLLNNNVVIVDTPGVSDLNEQRCDVTYNFIPKANAVLFLLDANSPLKKSEIDFIEEKLLAQGIDNIIFLVNKYDNVDEEEEEDFWENLQLHMLKAFAESEYKLKNLNMYPLSAKMALRGVLDNDQEFIAASGIEEVKAALQKTVSEGRVEEEKLARYKARVQAVLLNLNSELENKRALKAADIDKLHEAQTALHELLEEQVENKQKITGFVQEEKKNIIAMTDKSLRFFYKRLEDRIVDDVQFYKGLDFKDYVEQRVSKAIQRELENWLMSYAPNIDVLLRTVEKEIARGISYRFNQKIALNANLGNKPGSGGYGVNVTALDVSNATVKAGALTAGGAGLLMLIGGPILMPFISMAAFPFLQRKFLEDQLATAKEQSIPAIQEQLADCILRMQQELHKYIDEKCLMISKNSEYAYDTVLENLRVSIDEEIQQKKNMSNDLGAELGNLNTEIASINSALQALQEVQ